MISAFEEEANDRRNREAITEERYEDPSDHDWNYDYDENQYITADDYPEPARKRWLRLFDRRYDDEE